MVAKFYKCSCDKNHVNKSTYLSGEITYSSTYLKQPTSITDPVIMLTSPGTEANPFTLNHNYMYLPSMNRYYFINDIISVRDGLYELHCHVDVLYSYSSYLTNILTAPTALVSRQETFIDNKLVDPEIAFDTGMDVTTITGSAMYEDATLSSQVVVGMTVISGS